MWMVMLNCGRPPPNRASSSGCLPSRPERWSCAIKDSCQLIRVFAFAFEGAADSREGLGERKSLVRNQQLGIFCSNRMPVHTLGSNGAFRHESGPSHCDTVAGNPPQRDPASDSVFCRNLLLVEELI